MVGLDTFKLKLPIDHVKGINYSKFSDTETKSQKGIEIRNVDIHKNIDYGLNAIQVDNLRGEIIISGSAKILKDNYKQSISLNTLDQFTEEINKHGFIEVASDKLLRSTLLVCDPVNTMRVTDLNKSVRSVIQFANMNSSYEVGSYLTKGSLGYTAKRKVKSYKERQVGYSKLHDLKKDKHNRDFSKDYPKMIRSFNLNDIRVESNIVAKSQMKKHFKVVNTSLGSILNSSENVNSNVFQRIIKTGVQMDLFSDSFMSMAMTKIVKEYGYKSIFNQFGNNWDKVEQWIKVKMPRGKSNSAYYQINIFKDAFQRLNDIDSSVNTSIEELSYLLKQA